MKKLVAVILFTFLAVSFALAQTGNTNYVPTVDVLGGHNNGGRGCSGCHAPHSGGRGSGGVIAGATWNTVTSIVNGTPVTGSATPTATGAGVALGDVGLWGTDPGPLTSGMPILYQNTGAWNGYTNLSGTSFANGEIFSGIVTCLTCHDGNVSKGAMMANQSYEQFYGTLPTGNITGQPIYNQNSTSAGFQKIPTLLGNDGGTLGDYNNDHPIGPMATIAKAGLCRTAAACGGTTTGGASGITLTDAGGFYQIGAAAGSPFDNFLQNYGAPALKNLAAPDTAEGSPTATVESAWVTCTTCHNQHNMVVYKAGDGSVSYRGVQINKAATGKYATYFFVNGPYNPGAPMDGSHAPSTMQFCRQCHFSFSNESYGLNSIGTAF